MSKIKSFPDKDPESKLDYVFDWAPKRNNTGLSNWLRDDETIITHSVTVPDGITKISSELINDNTAVLVWLDSGVLDTSYEIVCKIETTQNRKDIRRANILVRKR